MQSGLSESARVTTAAEARFRINYPNSKPRRSRIIALDTVAEEALRRISVNWPSSDAHFLRYLEPKGANESLKMLPVDAVLVNGKGDKVSLVAEITDADVIVMVTTAGASAASAEVIGNACFVRGKMTTGLVLNTTNVSDMELAGTLTAMRPFAAMLVISNGEEYVQEMLSALRA